MAIEGMIEGIEIVRLGVPKDEEFSLVNGKICVGWQTGGAQFCIRPMPGWTISREPEGAAGWAWHADRVLREPEPVTVTIYARTSRQLDKARGIADRLGRSIEWVKFE